MSFALLPNVVLLEIFKHLSIFDVPHVMKTCKQFKNPKVWDQYWKIKYLTLNPNEKNEANTSWKKLFLNSPLLLFHGALDGYLRCSHHMPNMPLHKNISKAWLKGETLHMQIMNTKNISALNLTNKKKDALGEGCIIGNTFIKREKQIYSLEIRYDVSDITNMRTRMSILLYDDLRLLPFEEENFLYFQSDTTRIVSRLDLNKLNLNKKKFINQEQYPKYSVSRPSQCLYWHSEDHANFATYNQKTNGFLCCGYDRIISCVNTILEVHHLDSDETTDYDLSKQLGKDMKALPRTARLVSRDVLVALFGFDRIIKLDFVNNRASVIQFSDDQHIRLGPVIENTLFFSSHDKIFLGDFIKKEFVEVLKTDSETPVNIKIEGNKLLVFNQNNIWIYGIARNTNAPLTVVPKKNCTIF